VPDIVKKGLTHAESVGVLCGDKLSSLRLCGCILEVECVKVELIEVWWSLPCRCKGEYEDYTRDYYFRPLSQSPPHFSHDV
jgi:hypothetical protein